MSKVKVKVIKGPNFRLAEQKAYYILHEILLTKTKNRQEKIG